MTSRLRAVSIMALFLLIASACSAASDASASDSTVRTADQASGTTATTSESTTESTTSSSPPSIVDTDPDAGSDAGSGEGNFSARVDPIPAEQLGSIGDPLFPSLGNLGYDVLKYDIGINLTGTEFAAETVVTLRAVQELERFHLDLVGLDVIEIRIDDEPALFNRDGRELMIRPPQPLERGQTYDVSVAYEGTPQPIADPATPSVLGWISEPWGTYVVSEPLGAATWFPANDHPRDKAIFDFAVTVPAGVTVAASGKLTGTTDAPANAGPEGSTTFNYAAADPMATYLASVVTGDFILTEPTKVSGIQIRHAVHSSIPETFAKELDTTTEMMVAFEEQFGPYPFESYGVVVVPENLGFALENQTLSIFGRDLLASESAQPILAHELAHQWFGNSVSVHEWDDIWLNEGFATWAEYWWRDRLVGPNSDILELFSEVPFDPLQPVPAEELFDGNVYIRGGLTLEAYERLVGPDEFREFLLEWSARYADATASNEQFLQLVEELHGPDVASALDPWIFDQTMPILPPK